MDLSKLYWLTNVGAEPPAIDVRRHVRTCGDAQVEIVEIVGSTREGQDASELARAVCRNVTGMRANHLVFDLRRLIPGPGRRWVNDFRVGLMLGLREERHYWVLDPTWMAEVGEGGTVVRGYVDVEQAVDAAGRDANKESDERRVFEAADLCRVVLRGGLGKLRFGMTQEDVREALGSPDEVEGEELRYEQFALRLRFGAAGGDRPEGLVTIETESPHAWLLGVSLLGWNGQRRREALEKVGVMRLYERWFRDFHFEGYAGGLTIESDESGVRAYWTIREGSASDTRWSEEPPVG